MTIRTTAWHRIMGAGLVIVTGGCLRTTLPPVTVHHGTDAAALSWPRAVELALAHHPDLRTAREEVLSKAHSRNAAFGDYLLGVDGSLTRKRSRTTGTVPTGDAMAFDLDVSQPLFTGFQTTGDYLEAKRNWEAARRAYEQTSADVRLRLRTVFVELLRLARLHGVDERIAQRRQENAELIQLRYEAGREHRGSLLRAQAIAEQAAFDVRQTQRGIESQSFAFGREVGGQFWLPARVGGDLEQMVPEPSQASPDYPALAEQTPGVRRLISVAEATKAAVLSAQGEFWPQVTGSFNYGYSGASASALRDDASLALTVSVPLFEGGKNVEGVLQANADYRAAVEAARAARDAAIDDLAEAWAAFRDARELLDVRRAFLEASRERAEIVRSQYTSGLVDFQDFDIAEQELDDSEKNFVRALADVLIRQAEWEQALGATLEDVVE